jgi:hypothetical protein
MPRGAKPAASSKPNPFDSDSDSESQPTKKSSAAYQAPADAKKRYKDGFRDAGGLENQSVEELEHYAAYKAEETTDALAGCLRIAEDIKQDATDTLITLHKQGEQISRTHEKAVEIDQDLTKVSACVLTMASGVSSCRQPVLSLIVSFSFFFCSVVERDPSREPWRVLLQAMEAQENEEDQGTCRGVSRYLL